MCSDRIHSVWESESATIADKLWCEEENIIGRMILPNERRTRAFYGPLLAHHHKNEGFLSVNIGIHNSSIDTVTGEIETL